MVVMMLMFWTPRTLLADQSIEDEIAYVNKKSTCHHVILLMPEMLHRLKSVYRIVWVHVVRSFAPPPHPQCQCCVIKGLSAQCPK